MDDEDKAKSGVQIGYSLNCDKRCPIQSASSKEMVDEATRHRRQPWWTRQQVGLGEEATSIKNF